MSTPVAFLWHLHQPDYRDPVGGDMALPWVRLHATRGYTDLARVLERHPEVRATVTLTPSLVSQLQDLVHGRCSDRFLRLTHRRAAELSLADRIEILRGFFLASWERDVRPLPRYWALLHRRGRDLRGVDLERVAEDFSDQDFRDLQVLFNLAWMGFTARREEEVVKNLIRKGEQFTEVDKEVLLDCQERVVARVLPRWQGLAARGQVELSTTPLHHPILPLLVDTDAARAARPEATLPARTTRLEDARAQVALGLAAHERAFGSRPAGLWPPEGGVSEAALALLAEAGLTWAASDEEILRQSQRAEDAPADPYRVWALETGAGPIRLLFRDRTLSDLLGFAYAHNEAEDAVSDLLGRLGRIEGEVVPIILDGENPWQHYPRSGEQFLELLHDRLVADGIQTLTFSEAVASAPAPAPISRLHAGSWIEGDFRVWIGHPETNLAWQLLADAGHALDQRGGELAACNREEACEHLRVAEGSDWFWWYGDDFVAETPEIFDALFRSRLTKVYELLGERTPPRLRLPISEAAVGAVRAAPLREPVREVTPVIDGYAAPYVDWLGAGLYRPPHGRGDMYLGSLNAAALYYGADITEVCLRVDFDPRVRDGTAADRLVLELVHDDHQVRLSASLTPGCGTFTDPDGQAVGQFCRQEVAEATVPIEAVGLPRGEVVRLAVHLYRAAVEIERLPRYGYLSLRLSAGRPGTGSASA